MVALLGVGLARALRALPPSQTLPRSLREGGFPPSHSPLSSCRFDIMVGGLGSPTSQELQLTEFIAFEIKNQPASLRSDECPASRGTGVQLDVEQVSSLTWNDCPASCGTGDHFPWNTHVNPGGCVEATSTALAQAPKTAHPSRPAPSRWPSTRSAPPPPPRPRPAASRPAPP